MLRTAPLMALSFALVLSACSKAEDEPDASASTPSLTTAEQSEPVAEGGDDLTGPDVPAIAPSEQNTEMVEIPKSIRGRWGLVARDCTATAGEAKGLLTVSATQLTFYESVAALGKVTLADPNRMRGTFRYSGEGQSWIQDVALELQADGKTMIRRDFGPDALPGPQKYTRCN